MSAQPADRNLLFGILALQLDFIQRDQLIAAMHAWVLAKHRPLGEILLEQAALDSSRCGLLEALVAEHLKQHANDPLKSLAALSPPAPDVRDGLEQVGDAEVHASLGQVFAANENSSSTLASTVGESTSAGTRFRVLRPHAQGGLGRVFVARDQELNREVALKEIQDRHAYDASSRARFLLEAEITGGLEHPGIVPVYGLGHYADGRPFYAMRFIRGDSLKEAIARFHAASVPTGHGPDDGPASRETSSTPPGKSSRLVGGTSRGMYHGERLVEFRKLLGRFVDVCQAIAYAHSRGVLHRDLKPGNIMLGKYGETLVVDWGLAKAGVRQEIGGKQQEAASDGPGGSGSPGETADDRQEPLLRPSSSGSAETLAGSAIGTPAYMSPEQAEGRLDLLGPASDVYSLGATLYTLLTGTRPIEDAGVEEILRKVRQGEFPRPRQVRPDLPPGLEAVCLKAMALRREDRYASPKDLAEDVERWLADEPVSARPEPWTVKARRWMGRHRVFVSSAAAVLIVATAALFVGNLLLSRANADLYEANKTIQKNNEDLRLANEQTKLAYGKLETSERDVRAQLRRSEALLYNSTIREAAGYWRDGNYLGMRATLDSCKPALRGPEHHYLARHSEPFRVLGEHSRVSNLVLSADGQQLFSAGWDVGAFRLGEPAREGTIKVWDLTTGKERTIAGRGPKVVSLLLSRDGKKLLLGKEHNGLKVWDIEADKELVTLDTNFRSTSLALSTDGKRVFSGGVLDHVIRVWDLEKGKEVRGLSGHAGPVRSLVLSNDGSRLFSGGDDKTIKVWDVEASKDVMTLTGHTFPINALAVSVDGKRLFSGGSDSTVKVWDLDAGKEQRTFSGHLGPVTSLALAADGTRLFSGSVDSTIKMWDLEAGKELATLRGHTAEVWSVVLSSDQKRLYSGGWDNTIKVWNLDAGSEPRALRGHNQRVGCLVWAPDSKRLYSGSEDGNIKIWDLESSKEPFTLPGHKSPVSSLALSADGNRLFTGSSSIGVWDLHARKKTVALEPVGLGEGWAAIISSVALSNDEKRLFSANDGVITIWNLEKNKEASVLRPIFATARLAMSQNGNRLVSMGVDGSIQVWDPQAGTNLLTLPARKKGFFPAGGPPSIALSRDGKLLFAVKSDDMIKVWDLEKGEELLTLSGHKGVVTCLALSADGTRLFSGSVDKTIKIWDLEVGKEALTLAGHKAGVSSVAPSPDGNILVSGSIDGTIVVWDFRAEKIASAKEPPP